MAAGPGGRIRARDDRIDIDRELIDFLVVADNIHDFSGERSNIPIDRIINSRLEGNKYYEVLREMIGSLERKPKNFEKMVQNFLERFLTTRIDEIYNYNSPEHTMFIDCNDNDPNNLNKVLGRDCVIFRVLISRDRDRNKYIDYNNRTQLITGLNSFFGKSKDNVRGKDYLPIIFDASSFSPKNIFYVLNSENTNIVTGIFGGILVEESTHNDSATKIKNNNFYPGCKALDIDKLLNGETMTYSTSDSEVPKRKTIKLLVNHSNLLPNQPIRMIEDTIDLRGKDIDRIEKVEIPSISDFKYFLTNNNSFCSAVIIIVSPRGRQIGIKMSVFSENNLFNITSITNYINGLVTNELFDRIFRILDIKEIETKLNILMDLKRSGDWGQVMMIKHSDNKAVLFTSDRMLFNYARLQQIPVIFTTSPNIDIEEDDNSQYVDLVCYTPNKNGILNENIANIIELAKVGIERDKIREGIEMLKRYKVELTNYFVGEVRPFKIPDDLKDLNEMIGNLKRIRVKEEIIEITVGIPEKLVVFYNCLVMIINLINFSYYVFINFYNEVDSIERDFAIEELEVIRERINRQITNYNVLIIMKNIRIIVKNFTTLFSNIEGGTESISVGKEFRTSNITKIATSLFLGINLNTLFSNIQYLIIFNLDNPQFTIENIMNFISLIAGPIKSLIENNIEVSEEDKMGLFLNNREEFREYINLVNRLIEMPLDRKTELFIDINTIKNPISERVGGVLRRRGGGGIDFKSYINLDNVNVYFYTYYTRLLLEAINIDDFSEKVKLNKYLRGFNYSKILGIIGGNIIDNREEIPYDFFSLHPKDLIGLFTVERLINSPNTRVYIYTVLTKQLIDNYGTYKEEILEGFEKLELVYSDILGICSINIVIRDAIIEKTARPIEIAILPELKETRKRLLEEEVEIIGPERVEQVLIERKPSMIYSQPKLRRIIALGDEPYDGGKIRIMKKSMKNVYLDDLEKEIIKWGIKKGYIHKSNYLDLQKLLKY